MKWNALYKKQFFVLAFCFFVFNAMAQNHFIYIQSDNKKAFSANLDGKNFSSSQSGYLIIPKLVAGEYQLKVTFPQDQAGEQKFTIKIKNRDDGYALKDFGEKGWGLSNLQTMEVLMSQSAPIQTDTAQQTTSEPVVPQTDTAQQTTSEPVVPQTDTVVTELPKTEPAVVKTNLFGQMLSEVVDDPNLTKEGFVTRPKKKKVTGKKTKADTVAVEDNATAALPAITTAPENIYDSYDAAKTRGIIKVAEISTDTGTDFVFIDFNSQSQDTIRLFIPSDSNSIAEEIDVADNTANKTDSLIARADSTSFKQDSSQLTIVKETAPAKTSGYQPYSPNEKPFLQFPPKTDTIIPEKKEIANPFFNKTDSGSNNSQPELTAGNVETSTQQQPAASSLTNSDCKKMVTDEELVKWKKRMISAGSDAEMIKTANKLMPGKCITTEQVKNLGGLFLSDEGRYNFFDAAYAFTYDYGKYAMLESQLFDNYYKKRFKAILR